MKTTLTIDQMKELKRIGLKGTNASMNLVTIRKPDKTIIKRVIPKNAMDDIQIEGLKSVYPVYTIDDILQMLPKSLDTSDGSYLLSIEIELYNEWSVSYSKERSKYIEYLYSESEPELIDALYDMLYIVCTRQ